MCGSARAAQAWVTKDEPDDEGVDGAHAIAHAAQRDFGATKHGMQKRVARSEVVQRRWRGRSDGSGDGRDDGVQDVWRCDTGLRRTSAGGVLAKSGGRDEQRSVARLTIEDDTDRGERGLLAGRDAEDASSMPPP